MCSKGFKIPPRGRIFVTGAMDGAAVAPSDREDGGVRQLLCLFCRLAGALSRLFSVNDVVGKSFCIKSSSLSTGKLAVPEVCEMVMVAVMHRVITVRIFTMNQMPHSQEGRIVWKWQSLKVTRVYRTAVIT